MSEPKTTSTRPYLIRALHEWCSDNGLTPYLAVRVDRSVQVPAEYVQDGQIVLNISYDSTGSLQLGNEFIEFKARFSGRVREIMVPVSRVMAIYARENGQGMSFPVEEDLPAVEALEAASKVQEANQAPDVAPDGGDRVVQLVSTEAFDDPDGEDGEIQPPRPPSGGGRPALKRVK